MGALAGMVVTRIVQSSSITTGLCILLVQQAILPATAAIPIVIGANIGTTATALVASIKMQKTARQVALANLGFNAFGVVLFLPFLGWFAAKVVAFAGEPGMAVAWAQLTITLRPRMRSTAKHIPQRRTDTGCAPDKPEHSPDALCTPAVRAPKAQEMLSSPQIISSGPICFSHFFDSWKQHGAEREISQGRIFCAA